LGDEGVLFITVDYIIKTGNAFLAILEQKFN
jgi:hypothetical protein